MVGGDKAAFDEVKPLLNAMGNPERVVRIGDSGAGQLCKVCNQMVIGGTLAVVRRSARPWRARRASIRRRYGRRCSAALRRAGCWKSTVSASSRVITPPDFAPALYAKDYRIASATIAEHHVPAPVSAVVRQLVDALIAAGRGEDDYSALATVLFDRAGL